MNIEELIQDLQDQKEKGHSELRLKDPDTGWHLKIVGTRQSNNEPGITLIVAENYADFANR